MTHPTTSSARVWHDSAHASLCLLGAHLRTIGFFREPEVGITIRQRVRTYTPGQQLEMLLVSLLAGATAISHSNRTPGVDEALQAAFGLPGCADQSVIADTLDAATPEEDLEGRPPRSPQLSTPSSAASAVPVTMTMSPPCSPSIWTSPRCRPVGRRSHPSGGTSGGAARRRGLKLVRVRADSYQEVIYEEVCSSNTAESLPVLQRADPSGAWRPRDSWGWTATVRPRRSSGHGPRSGWIVAGGATRVGAGRTRWLGSASGRWGWRWVRRVM